MECGGVAYVVQGRVQVSKGPPNLCAEAGLRQLILLQSPEEVASKCPRLQGLHGQERDGSVAPVGCTC